MSLSKSSRVLAACMLIGSTYSDSTVNPVGRYCGKSSVYSIPFAISLDASSNMTADFKVVFGNAGFVFNDKVPFSIKDKRLVISPDNKEFTEFLGKLPIPLTPDSFAVSWNPEKDVLDSTVNAGIFLSVTVPLDKIVCTQPLQAGAYTAADNLVSVLVTTKDGYPSSGTLLMEVSDDLAKYVSASDVMEYTADDNGILTLTGPDIKGTDASFILEKVPGMDSLALIYQREGEIRTIIMPKEADVDRADAGYLW